MRPPTRFLQDLIARRQRPYGPRDALEADVLVTRLGASLHEQRLVVVTGAGLSYANGFPTWPELLDRLSTELAPPAERAGFAQLAAYDSPLVVARYLKSRLEVAAGFPAAVHRALYSGADYTVNNGTLDLIVALVELTYRRGARLDIITYNFDDLLESTLAARHPGSDVAVVHTAEHYFAPAAAVRILHVHGLLPRDASIQPALSAQSLVLSEDDFHQLMNNASAWQNRVQVEAFAHRDCLFVGMSMTDPNLRRVLDYAKHGAVSTARRSRWIIGRHYVAGDTLAPRTAALTAIEADGINAIKDRLLQELGAEALYLKAFSDLVPLSAKIRALP